MSPRLTRRGRVLLAATLGALLVVTTVVVVRTFFGDSCTVTAQGREVHLDRGEAERVTAAAATARRQGVRASTAIARVTDLSVDDRAAVVAAASGQARAALTCKDGGASDSESDRLDGSGLTARAERVRRDVDTRFGDLPMGGFAPGGVHSGHMPGSAHYEGRAVDVFFRPINGANKTRGWALAQYLVAHAERLQIDTVIFDGRIWTARRSVQGWRDYRVSHARRSAATVAILEHRDHVHVDVAD